jgi:hypothetical protein
VASVSAVNESWMSAAPGGMNAPMSALVVMPTRAE